MQEFLLYAQVPLARHNQALQILTGIAGAQPTDLYERHMIYKPLQTTLAAAKKGGSQRPPPPQKATLYQRLLQSVREDDFGAMEGKSIEKPWVSRIEEFPEAGLTKYVARGVDETAVGDTGSFLDKSRFSPIAEFVIAGHLIVHKNVVSKLHQTLMLSTSDLNPNAPLPALDQLHLLDPSGTFLLEVSVRVGERNKSNLVENATKELLAFKELLRGAIDLRVPDRLSLDTRVKKQ